MIWGYAGIWRREFGVYDVEDPVMARLQFLVDRGFHSGGISLAEMQDPQRRDQIAQFAAEHDLQLITHPRIRAFGWDDDTIRQKTDEFMADLQAYKDLLSIPIVAFGAGPVHRFMEKPSLQEQLDRLTEVLTPLAAGCYELGCPLGIENHVDYYCSDLVELCGRVPRLGILLDTGNTYVIGEKPIPAAREAAPFVIGTHFKDHTVYPDEKNLTLVVKGAVLGRGHVGLAEIHRILLENAPDPSRLVMLWELVPPGEMDGLEAIEESWKFIRSLPGFDMDIKKRKMP